MRKRSSKIKKRLRPRANATASARAAEELVHEEETVARRPAGHARVKNRAAIELGRLGGRKGGIARAKKLSARRRSMIARKAAQARWAKRSR
jgi:hypothetical protein